MENTLIIKYPKVYLEIVKEVDKHSELLDCSDRLINKILRRVQKYVGDDKRKATHFGVFVRMIRQEIGTAFREKKKEHDVYLFSSLRVFTESDFGESADFDPEDLLAQGGEAVIENISLNEKIARLATGDREIITLNAWANGFNDTQVSVTLASHFGGNKETYRKFVQRFKAKCQAKLEKECHANNLLIKTA